MPSRPSIHDYYLNMLSLVETRGTCRRRKVAAILTTSKGKLISTGYNGTPSGLVHCIDRPCAGARDMSGDNSRCEAIHAETNAIVQAGSRLDEAEVLYCSVSPCFNCVKLLITAGVKEIYCKSMYTDREGLGLLVRAGIALYVADVGPEHIGYTFARISQEAIDSLLDG